MSFYRAREKVTFSNSKYFDLYCAMLDTFCCRGAAYNRFYLHKLGVTHVLNAAEGNKNGTVDTNKVRNRQNRTLYRQSSYRSTTLLGESLIKGYNSWMFPRLTSLFILMMLLNTLMKL